jgi:aconitase A
MGASRELFIKEREAQASRNDEDYQYLQWSLQNKSNKSNTKKAVRPKK